MSETSKIINAADIKLCPFMEVRSALGQPPAYGACMGLRCKRYVEVEGGQCADTIIAKSLYHLAFFKDSSLLKRVK